MAPHCRVALAKSPSRRSSSRLLPLPTSSPSRSPRVALPSTFLSPFASPVSPITLASALPSRRPRYLPSSPAALAAISTPPAAISTPPAAISTPPRSYFLLSRYYIITSRYSIPSPTQSRLPIRRRCNFRPPVLESRRPPAALPLPILSFSKNRSSFVRRPAVACHDALPFPAPSPPVVRCEGLPSPSRRPSRRPVVALTISPPISLALMISPHIYLALTISPPISLALTISPPISLALTISPPISIALTVSPPIALALAISPPISRMRSPSLLPSPMPYPSLSPFAARRPGYS
ncbi:unnamed protein product [Closterium sp. Naga37s-1]|nr:unnamed protein product [Closterium sp. Naga37s-1]